MATAKGTQKTEFLQIRLTQEDRRRIAEAAARDHLDPSTWARRMILLALETTVQTATPKNNRKRSGHQ
jgi:hypothetical protein